MNNYQTSGRRAGTTDRRYRAGLEPVGAAVERHSRGTLRSAARLDTY